MDETRIEVKYEPVAGKNLDGQDLASEAGDANNGKGEIQFVAVGAKMNSETDSHSKKFLFIAACAG